MADIPLTDEQEKEALVMEWTSYADQQNKKNFKAPKLEQTEKLLGIGSEQPKPENKTVQTKAAKAPAANPKSTKKAASTNSKNKDKVNFLAK